MFKRESETEVKCFGCAAIGLLCSQHKVTSEERAAHTAHGVQISNSLEGSIFDCVVEPEYVAIKGTQVYRDAAHIEGEPEIDVVSNWFQVLAERGYSLPFENVTSGETESYYLYLSTLREQLAQTVQQIDKGKLKPRYTSEVANLSESRVMKCLRSDVFQNFFLADTLSPVPVNSPEDSKGVDLTINLTEELGTILNERADSAVYVQVKSSSTKVEEFCRAFTTPGAKKSPYKNLRKTPFLVLNGRGKAPEADQLVTAAISAELVALAELRSGITGRIKSIEMLPPSYRRELLEVLHSVEFGTQYGTALACYYAQDEIIWPGGKPLKMPKSGKKSKVLPLPMIGQHAIEQLINNLEQL